MRCVEFKHEGSNSSCGREDKNVEAECRVGPGYGVGCLSCSDGTNEIFIDMNQVRAGDLRQSVFKSECSKAEGVSYQF